MDYRFLYPDHHVYQPTIYVGKSAGAGSPPEPSGLVPLQALQKETLEPLSFSYLQLHPIQSILNQTLGYPSVGDLAPDAPSLSLQLQDASDPRWSNETAATIASTPVTDSGNALSALPHPHVTLSSDNSHLIYIPQPGRSIGGGGFCDLFVGFYAPTGGKLAMKRLRPRSQHPEALEIAERRLTREARIWSSLKHTNVLPFYGLVDLSGETYLVSPWMEHGDLSQFLTGRLSYLEPCGVQSTPTEALRVAYRAFNEEETIFGIASGLAYLHANNVIHGDLKGANILLDNAMSPLLGDFGMTKDPEFQLTSPDMRGKGTTRWMSPELLDASHKTTSSDMFAFAMMIVEVLTGRPPFPDLTTFRAGHAIATGRRPPFEPLSRDGRNFEELWNIAAACWDEEPGKRPGSENVVAVLAAHRRQKMELALLIYLAPAPCTIS
ncbi:hypothetical protein FRB95_000636 [Tulasnella sp. JGI-2019a]|nr:hypothetical protein FRB95_000636 [Tulasnella sp. JGI-2019a]